MNSLRSRRAVLQMPRSDGQALGNNAAEADTSGPSRGIKLIGSILAPTTFLTALLLYFGNQHANWYFNYFGVNATIMDLSTREYVIRSVDPLFSPVTSAAGACLAGLWGYRLLRRRLSDAAWRRMVRALMPAAAVVGFLLVGVAVLGVVEPPRWLDKLVGFPGLALAVGVLLLVAALRIDRMLSSCTDDHDPAAMAAAEWAAIFVLVGIGLFWAVTDYANAVGTGRGVETLERLGQQPDVTIYSQQSLALSAPGVQEVACQTPDAAYGFRYDGLKLVLEAGGNYFFLPAQWNRSDGVAFVIPRTDTLRLEFTAPNNERDDWC